jgi:hypothetical protein
MDEKRTKSHCPKKKRRKKKKKKTKMKKIEKIAYS